MIGQIKSVWMRFGFSTLEMESCGHSALSYGSCIVANKSIESDCHPINAGKEFPGFGVISYPRRIHRWKISFALDPGGVPGNDGQENIDGNGAGLESTRLGRIALAGARQLVEKLNTARKKLPMKIFLLLLGFYTANALATILGQTGDWDVLVAGVVVAAIEGIGMLMYKNPSSMTSGRLQRFIGMMNYWKAGVCLGLFVDAFKLGS